MFKRATSFSKDKYNNRHGNSLNKQTNKQTRKQFILTLLDVYIFDR